MPTTTSQFELVAFYAHESTFVVLITVSGFTRSKNRHKQVLWSLSKPIKIIFCPEQKLCAETLPCQTRQLHRGRKLISIEASSVDDVSNDAFAFSPDLSALLEQEVGRKPSQELERNKSHEILVDSTAKCPFPEGLSRPE